MKAAHLVILLALNCGWATLPALVNRFESELTPLEFVSLRYGFALAGLVLVWRWLPGQLPRGRDFWRTAIMGITVFTVGHQLQILGMQRSAASDAAVLLVLDPLISSLGAALFLHERIPGQRWAGFALAIGGVILLSLWNNSAPLPGLFANLMIVLSFVSEAVWSVMGKPLVSRWGIPKVTALALAAGTLGNGLLLLPDASTHASRFAAVSWEAWIWLAILGIVLTAVGYSVWHVVIREVPVSVAAMTIYLQPIVGTALAVVWAGEQPHAGHAWGSLAIIAGIILGVQRSKKMPAAAPSSP
ncbi:MAG: DMT family transporter [Limisphaerales bacterium]